jgi:hypothetical protein
MKVKFDLAGALGFVSGLFGDPDRIGLWLRGV